jgi:hypothetical protein
MGLLDDAIREHLELKRRSGADADEVHRLEQEALGPARRNPEAAEEPFDDEAGAPDEEAEPDDYVAAPQDEEVEALAEDEEPFYDDDLLGEPSDDELEAQDGPPAPPPLDADAASGVDQPTVQFDVAERDDDHDEDGAAAEHDELEETPEFLQETPEHDRLWFEQKPPRDFDF